MASTPAPASDLSKLTWQSQCGTKVATDSRCLYMREGIGSIIAGAFFSVLIAGSAGWLAYTIFFIQPTTTAGEKAFGVLLLIIVAVFCYVPWPTLRHGRWMITYDRGEPGTPGEIRFNNGRRISMERVRCISTRNVGGSPPRGSVVAELHDGTHEFLGPSGISTWPAHFGQQAATWMGVPYRHSAS